jgi:hypothetical protein
MVDRCENLFNGVVDRHYSFSSGMFGWSQAALPIEVHADCIRVALVDQAAAADEKRVFAWRSTAMLWVITERSNLFSSEA